MVDFLELNFLENKITSRQSLCKSLRKISQSLLRQYESRPVSSHLLRVHLDFFSALADFGVLDFQSVLRVFALFSGLFGDVLRRLLECASVSACHEVDDFARFFRIDFCDRENQQLRGSRRNRTFRSKKATYASRMHSPAPATRFIEYDEDFGVFQEMLKLLLRICVFANFISRIISKMLFITCLFFFKQVYIADPTLAV